MNARASAGERPGPVEQPQQADGGCERKGELLRRAPAGRMHPTRVGRHKRRAETHATQFERALEIGRRLSCPVDREWSAGRGGERIEAERHCGVRRVHACTLNESGKCERLPRTLAAEVELEMRPRVETQPVESLVKGCGIELPEAVAVGANRAGEHDLQTVRAIDEVVESLGIGLAGFRVVKARDHAPGPVGSKRPRAFRRSIDGLDPDAVGGLGDKRVEVRAIKRRFGGPAPIGFGIGGKRLAAAPNADLR